MTILGWVIIALFAAGAAFALRAARRSQSETQTLLAANECLLQALHDAIVSERDIVPKSAEPFYDPARARQSEQILSNTEDVAALLRTRPDLIKPGMASAERTLTEMRGLHRKHYEE